MLISLETVDASAVMNTSTVRNTKSQRTDYENLCTPNWSMHLAIHVRN